MNRVILILSITLSIIAVSCKTDTLPDMADLYAPQKVTISGKILNHKDHPEASAVDMYVKDLVDSYNNSHSEGIEEDGTFNIEFDKSFPSDIFFRYKNILTLFVEPGDVIHIEIDANKFLATDENNQINKDAVRYSGDNSVINNEIWNYQAEMYKYYSPRDVSIKEKELDEEGFLAYMDTVRQKKYEIVDSLDKAEGLSDLFKHWVGFVIDYEYSSRLLHFIWYSPRANARRGEKPGPLEVSDKFYEAVNSVEQDNRNAIICSDYRDFLLEHNMNAIFDKSVLNKRMKETGGGVVETDEFVEIYRTFLAQTDSLYQGSAKDIVLGQRVLDLIFGFRQLEVFEILYPEFKDKLHKDFVDCIEVKYNQVLEDKEAEKEAAEAAKAASDSTAVQ